jgi:hypothetical protein
MMNSVKCQGIARLMSYSSVARVDDAVVFMIIIICQATGSNDVVSTKVSFGGSCSKEQLIYHAKAFIHVLSFHDTTGFLSSPLPYGHPTALRRTMDSMVCSFDVTSTKPGLCGGHKEERQRLSVNERKAMQVILVKQIRLNENFML